MKGVNKYSLLLFFAMILSACNQQNTDQKEEKQKPIVSVSVLPVKYFTEQIAGEFLHVNVMIPGGASPATYEPSPEQMKKLLKSDAYLTIPVLSFEKAWLPKFKSSNKELEFYNLTTGIELNELAGHHHGEEEHHHGHSHDYVADPHIWVSPSTVLRMVENIADALLELYPEKQHEIKENYARLASDIKMKNEKASKVLRETQNKSFLIFHPALGYLARDYNLNQIIIENHGKEPSPRQLQKVVELARHHNVEHIFVQKQFDVKNAEAVAKELDIELVVIDPLAENWNEEIDRIINHFR